MENVKLTGEVRKASGTRAARRVRAEGRLPAIIYGHGEEPVAISLLRHDVEVALAHGARTMEVEIDGQTAPYLIKNVQYDYLGTTPIHMDLTRVDLTERVKVRVGIEPRGVPKGTHEGGVLDLVMAHVEVECLVTAIPDTLHPVVTELDLGESLLVKDLQLPEGVVALADPEDRVATVRVLAVHAAEVAEAETEEGEEKEAEPERIGRVRKDEEAAEDKS
jgi:large subunit ribosomal protein L25